MTSSNIRRLGNEMKIIEEESGRFIPRNRYYVISINIDTQDYKTVEREGKKLLKNKNHQPLSVYVFHANIFMVFSCLEEGDVHYNSGNHHEIVSKYASMFGAIFKESVVVNIVEFDSRIQIVAYFTWKVHENVGIVMKSISNGSIKSLDFQKKTHQELINELREIGIEWDSLMCSERYGTFYRLKKKDGKIVIASISETLDARNTNRYTTFIFGK